MSRALKAMEEMKLIEKKALTEPYRPGAYWLTAKGKKILMAYDGSDTLCKIYSDTNILAAGGTSRPLWFGVGANGIIVESFRLLTDSRIQLNKDMIQGTGTNIGVNNVAGSVVAKVKAGSPADGDFTTATDGLVVVDSTNNKIWARVGGAWKGVAIS
jgi:hypothetical protein